MKAKNYDYIRIADGAKTLCERDSSDNESKNFNASFMGFVEIIKRNPAGIPLNLLCRPTI